MDYIVSARKWRPQTFDQLIGQQHIVNALKSEIEQGKIAHAYMFSGPRGIGKTSTARILAKALNCKDNGPRITPCNKCENCLEITASNSIDVHEIDGASNNSVNQVREIIEYVKYQPQKSRYKIYIIDEFHMLSNSAFNALLKTLEEPPEHTIFITATTEIHKVIPTIKSRMKVFNFVPLNLNDIINQLKIIIKENNFTAEDDALFYIAKSAEGSMRDALSVLDVIMSVCDKNINPSDVLDILGLPKEDFYFSFIENVINKQAAQLINIINDIAARGENLSQFAYGLLEYFRHLLVIKKLNEAPVELIPLSKETRNKLLKYSEDFNDTQLLEILNLLIELNNDLKNAVNGKFIFEQYAIKISRYENFIDLGMIMAKLKEYEDKYKDFASIEKKSPGDNSSTLDFNSEEKTKSIEKHVLDITDNFFTDYVNNLNAEKHKRLISTLKIAKDVVKDKIENGELTLVFSDKWQYDDMIELKKQAEEEFFRIFDKEINIICKLKEKDPEELKEKRKNNLKLVKDLFSDES